MPPFTREDAARLIDESEGQVIDSSKPDGRGHAFAHVGSPQTPALFLPSRRSLTTMYRNRTQAEKDLRDLLNRHLPELDALPKGASITFEEPVSEPRQVHISQPAGARYSYAGDLVKNSTRQQLFVKLTRQVSGALHLRTMYLKG